MQDFQVLFTKGLQFRHNLRQKLGSDMENSNRNFVPVKCNQFTRLRCWRQMPAGRGQFLLSNRIRDDYFLQP